MKRFALPWAALLIAALALSTAAAEDQGRDIVVTFVDRSVDRPTLAGPGGYSPHGAQYQTTAWSHRITSHLARDYGLEMVTEWPVRSLGVHCVVFRVPASEDVDALMARLGRDRRVGSVQRMHQFRVLADDPYRKLQGALEALGVADAHHYATGRDVVVAVVDTGIDAGHPDLAGQILQETDFAPEHAGNIDDEVHGTAVAGVIAAVGDNGQGIMGVAPDAKVLALRACWPQQAGAGGAICNSLTLARALDNVLRLKPRILNLSLAGPADPLLQTLVEAAIAARIVVVAAEPAERSDDSAFPSAVPNVLRVRAAAANRAGRDGPVLEAPGTDILTTFPRGTYNYISGSSFAAAHISGVVALLLQLRPELTTGEVAAVLGEARGNYAGAVRNTVVSACQAVKLLRADAACGGTTGGSRLGTAGGTDERRADSTRRLAAKSG